MPAGWHCECGGAKRLVGVDYRCISTAKDLTRARRKHVRPSVAMVRNSLPAFFGRGITIELPALETWEVALLRAAGFIHRKHRSSPKRRAHKKRKNLRRAAYFLSDDGIAQLAEVKIKKHMELMEERYDVMLSE